MVLFSENLISDLIIISIGLLTVLIIYSKWALTYWKRKGYEYLEPSLPFGNTYSLITGSASMGDFFADIHNKMKSKGLQYVGLYLFLRPLLLVIDPKLIKNILQNDFQHFTSRGFYISEEVDPLSGNLFVLEHTKWRSLRTKLTPTFTSGKIKMMFNTLTDCAKELNSILKVEASRNSVLDIKDLVARFTTDIISSCAFGVESNCLKNPDVEFRKYGRRIVENTTWESFKFFLQFVVPSNYLSKFKFRVNKQDVEDFFMDLVEKTVDYREKNNISRKDFLQLLLELKQKKGELTMMELVAQCFVFYVGGFETSSTTMTFCLFELARNQHLQDKLRQEIRQVLAKHDNQLTYEAVMEMTYMDKVVDETLRKYPPLPILNRQCTKDYKIPNTPHVIEKGTMIFISSFAIQNDPEYYPDPDKFDPDRFNEENKKNRPQITYMPFGEGPRICIGLRFGFLQTKVGLATILNKYNLTINNKTKIPLEFEKSSFVTTAVDGIWLNVSEAN